MHAVWSKPGGVFVFGRKGRNLSRLGELCRVIGNEKVPRYSEQLERENQPVNFGA
jgi:hypothetical protein